VSRTCSTNAQKLDGVEIATKVESSSDKHRSMRKINDPLIKGLVKRGKRMLGNKVVIAQKFAERVVDIIRSDRSSSNDEVRHIPLKKLSHGGKQIPGPTIKSHAEVARMDVGQNLEQPESNGRNERPSGN